MKSEPLFQIITEIIEVICHRHLEDLRIFTEVSPKGAETLVILPHSADYPRLVGKHGGQINALNFLVQSAATILKVPIRIDLEESFIGKREPVEPFAFNPDFDLKTFHQRLTRMADLCSGRAWNFTVNPNQDTLLVTTPIERSSQTETFLSALEAVFKPYCYGSGRKLILRPQFLNSQPPT